MSEELDGELQPPMANGELVFDAPWQGRVFGMARALAEAGHYSWDEFRAELIRAIGEWDRSPAPEQGASFEYYNHFLLALERLLASKRVLGGDQLRDRADVLRARPHGHDH